LAPSASDAAALGADVAFLASGFGLAAAGGVGEDLEKVRGDLRLPVAIIFPEWSSDTREAYSALDREAGRMVINEADARAESEALLERISDGERVGLLPNDFIQCFKKQKECYNYMYDMFDSSGAIAWGMCGSGSACFAIYGGGGEGISGIDALGRLVQSARHDLKWIRRIIFSRGTAA
jgi:4-diphosphocytidyl-2-C-methyl-D-erythritol kinase